MTTVDAVISFDRKQFLGNGAFGEVFAAVQQPYGDVAVKHIECGVGAVTSTEAEWNALVAHLLKEADNLQKAEHEHVVRVHGVARDANRSHVYITTELCDGGSLESVIANGPIACGQAMPIVEQALLGLEALHVRGMVHRDLKPGNILLKKGQAKLSDFGLVSDELILGYASQRGYIPHLAPEVIRDHITSRRTDVWAMGLTIFRLLNGEPWFRREQERLGMDYPDGAKARVIRGNLGRDLEWMPHVHDRWRRFVRKALRDSSADRYANGGEMLTAHNKVREVSEPDWSCTHETDCLHWTAPFEKRTLHVEWSWTGRKHSVRAWSAPGADASDDARERTFVQVPNASRAEAVGALQAFFASRTR